jgi:hypothetical protein
MKIRDLNIVKCSGCGKEIVFIVPINGKKVPIDIKRVPVYFKIPEEDTPERPAGEWEKRSGHLSHFITCPKREQFSKGRRKP